MFSDRAYLQVADRGKPLAREVLGKSCTQGRPKPKDDLSSSKHTGTHDTDTHANGCDMAAGPFHSLSTKGATYLEMANGLMTRPPPSR